MNFSYLWAIVICFIRKIVKQIITHIMKHVYEFGIILYSYNIYKHDI